MSSAASAYTSALPGQLLKAGIYLGVIALLHFMQWLVLMPLLRWTIVGIILVAAFVPIRFSDLASGIGFLAVAGVAWFGYGNQLVTVLCAVLGAISLWTGIQAIRSSTQSPRSAPPNSP